MEITEYLSDKNKDNALKGVSILLVYDDENPTYRNDLLDYEILDYSIDSLIEIEQYIKTVSHEKGFLENYNTNILRLGAYLGEVLKAIPNTDLHWYDFETLSAIFETFKNQKKALSSIATLYSITTNIIYSPIAKIISFIENPEGLNLVNYAKLIELKSENNPSKKLIKYFSIHRDYYVGELKKIARAEKEYTPEVMVDLNNEHKDEVYRLYRFDFTSHKNDKISIHELDLEETINHPKIELLYEGMEFELYPLLWNSFNVICDVKKIDTKAYKKWIRKWIDIEDVRKKDNNGFENVIHHALPPTTENKNISLSIDLGSSDYETVLELIELLKQANCNFIKIGSFSVMKYDY